MPDVTVTMVYRASSDARHCLLDANGTERWFPKAELALDPAEPSADQEVEITMDQEFAERHRLWPEPEVS